MDLVKLAAQENIINCKACAPAATLCFDQRGQMTAERAPILLADWFSLNVHNKFFHNRFRVHFVWVHPMVAYPLLTSRSQTYVIPVRLVRVK
jgi:hypothetical protein